jgi:hypothetical protein
MKKQIHLPKEKDIQPYQYFLLLFLILILGILAK